jgi:hypothetical protein
MLKRDKVLSLLGDYTLCLESALFEHKLSSYNDVKPSLLGNVPARIINQFYEIVPNPFGDRDIELINGKKCTTKERTICEMIYNDRRDDLIIEAIKDYVDEGNKIGILQNKSKQYKLLGQLEYYISQIENYYTEV